LLLLFPGEAFEPRENVSIVVAFLTTAKTHVVEAEVNGGTAFISAVGGFSRSSYARFSAFQRTCTGTVSD